METKLTLKLDSSVIENIKEYSKKKHRSISKIAEDYFRTLINTKEENTKYTSLVRELSGVITESQLSDSGYTEYLEKKYE